MWRRNSVGQRHFGQQSAVNVDFRPGQCEQGDGRYWRCRKDAVANSKYCEQHEGRGLKRPREHEEYQTTGAATMTPNIAASRMASSDRFGQSSNHPVTELNRMNVSEENVNHSQAYMPNYSMPSSYLGLNYSGTMFTSNQPHPMVEASLVPDFGFISSVSYPNLPARFWFSNHMLLNPLEFHNQEVSHRYLSQTRPNYSIATWPDVQQMYINPLSGSVPVSWPHLTPYYSPVPEYFGLVPFPTYLGSRPIGEAFIYGNAITTAPSSNLTTSIPTYNNINAMTGEPDLRLEPRPPLATATATATATAGSTSANYIRGLDDLVTNLLAIVDDPAFSSQEWPCI